VRATENSSLWVCKISNSLKVKGVDFKDLNERAVLAHRLGKLLILPFPDFQIEPIDHILGLEKYKLPDKINTFCWLSRYIGDPLTDYLKYSKIENICNNHIIWDSVVFNLWIGNYDRKDSDYVVDNKNNLYLIDYHLWGPGFLLGDQLALGAYAESYSLTESQDTGWCVGAPFLLSHFIDKQFKMDKFLPMIEKIQALEDYKIRQSLKELQFTKENGEKLELEIFLSYLFKRRDLLQGVLHNWIRDGYPKGKRPKNPEHDDDLYPNI